MIDNLIYKITSEFSLTLQKIKINPNIYLNPHEYDIQINDQKENDKQKNNNMDDYKLNNKSDIRDNNILKVKKQKGGVFDISKISDFKNILDKKIIDGEIIKYISELDNYNEIINKDINILNNKITFLGNKMKFFTLESYKNIYSIYQIYTYAVSNSFYAHDDNYNLQNLLKKINTTFRNITPIKKSKLLNLTDYNNRRIFLNEKKKMIYPI